MQAHPRLVTSAGALGLTRREALGGSSDALTTTFMERRMNTELGLRQEQLRLEPQFGRATRHYFALRRVVDLPLRCTRYSRNVRPPSN